jgi:hypothetical protein
MVGEFMRFASLEGTKTGLLLIFLGIGVVTGLGAFSESADPSIGLFLADVFEGLTAGAVIGGIVVGLMKLSEPAP